MTTSEPFLALSPVAAALESLGASYYIGGLIASVHHGMPRSTMDVDIVANLRTEHVGPLVARLGDDYYADEYAIRQAIDAHSSFNLIHLPTMFKVDVFIPKPDSFQRSSQSRVLKDRPEDADREYPIATPEDLVLSKLIWYRDGGESSERQWLDVLGVVQVQGDKLDRDYLQTWAHKLDLGHILNRALRDAAL